MPVYAAVSCLPGFSGPAVQRPQARLPVGDSEGHHRDPGLAKAFEAFGHPHEMLMTSNGRTMEPLAEHRAPAMGSDIIKLFPGSAFGPSFVKAVKAPLPQVNIMPTGGVSLENMEEWFANGVVAVGAGGKLASGTDEEIIATAQSFVEKIKEIRAKMK